MGNKEDILKLFKHTHNNIEQEINVILKKKDLTLSQGHILYFLRNQENYQMHLKELEKALDVAQSTTAGLVVRLEKKKFIETLADKKDKRVKIVKLTDIGVSALDSFKVHMEDFEQKIFADFTEIELTLLTELFKKVNLNLKPD